MNTSLYMDKQIMDLSNSQSNGTNNDFINLMNPEEDDNKKEEIMPSYDFQPIRPTSSPPANFDSGNVGGARVWTSADSKINSGIRNYVSLDSTEPAKVIFEKDRNVYDAALLSEIDRTMKKHADNLLNALEGVSARLSHLESRARYLEHSVDDLKISVGNNHGSTDGKMRQLENILREVESGVHVVKDKQEILEAQLQVAKLQVSKVEQQSETPSTMHMDPVHQVASAPLQSHHQVPPIALTSQHPTHSPPNGPLPPQQNLPPSAQFPNQFSQNHIPPAPQRDAYFPTSGQTPESPIQQYQVPPQQQLQPPPTVPPQKQYQPNPVPQYSQPPPPPQQHPSLSAINAPQHQPQPQPPLGQHPEETPYIASQNFQPSIHQPPSHLPSGAPPLQQFYGTPSHMYEPPSSRPGPGFSAAHAPSSVPSEPYPYGGPPSQYGRGSPMKAQQLPSSLGGQSGGNVYPQLPTARILPHALPTASGVGSGSSSAGTGNKVPIDDVVDKVSNMGFSRDQVRATVRRLTENGQSVDLNVVLDKLMNDGEVQPPRGWFNR